MSQQDKPSNTEDTARRRKVREMAATIITRNDALLRSQAMDDNEYWLKVDKAQRQIILKHQFSGAQDSHIASEIDHERKVIYIVVEQDAGRVPVTQIAQFVVHGLDLGGEVAYDDDTGESYQCRRTPWRIVIRSGQQTYRLTITKQIEKNWDYNLELMPPCVP